MSTPSRSPNSLLPWAGLLIAGVGVIYQSGVISGDLAHDTDRITKLEAIDQSRTDRINVIDVRTARIETKMDMMLDQQGKDGRDSKDSTP